MKSLQKMFREPLSTMTHLFACFLAVIGAIVLLLLTREQPVKMLSLLVYGATMVALFAASSLLHGLKVEEKIQAWLNRIDHMAIFLLIAGTYTPIVYNFFPPEQRLPILVAVWLIALVGMAFKLLSARIGGFFNVVPYVLLSWGGAIPLVAVLLPSAELAMGGLVLLLLGGLIYTGGFVIYYTERPDPWPKVFGHHEIWHLCVMGASFCHYLFMLRYVVPAPTAS
jgi:hemolysin III